MSTPHPAARVARFDSVRLDVSAGELVLETGTVRLQQQPLQILVALLEHPHQVVTRDEIRAKLVTLPDGRRRSKPEFVDVQRVALATGRPLQDISRLAVAEAERHSDQ